MSQRWKAVILAAGKGTRMHSSLPKVLHPLRGRPLLGWVVDHLAPLQPEQLIAVVGYGADEVQRRFGDALSYVLQEPQLGTGHAVQCAAPLLRDYEGDVLVTCGDMPLIRTASFAALLRRRQREACAGVLMSAVLDPPPAYGRIVRGAQGEVERIVEERDCSPEQRLITEVNLGVYCFRANELVQVLGRLQSDNAQGEFYLTDVVELLIRRGGRVTAEVLEDPQEARGVNDPQALQTLEQLLLRSDPALEP